jgi:hypothetical protein
MASAVERAEQDVAAAGTSAPGTEEETPTPPSRDEKTDTGPPENIPYARFKEVNDQLRDLKGYVPVAEAGYDPDSVGRLVAFEQAYREDPAGTISSVVESMDLPDTTKNAIVAMLGNGEPAQADDTDDEVPDEPPEWAKPLVEDHEARQKAEENKYYNDLLTVGINHWKTLDEKDGIETPDRIILRQIRASVDDGEFRTVEELADKVDRGGMSPDEHRFVLGVLRPADRETGDHRHERGEREIGPVDMSPSVVAGSPGLSRPRVIRKSRRPSAIRKRAINDGRHRLSRQEGDGRAHGENAA